MVWPAKAGHSLYGSEQRSWSSTGRWLSLMTNVDYPWDAIERFFAARTEVNAAMRVYIESRGLAVPGDFFTVAYDKELAKKVMATAIHGNLPH
jgi:hypothetical protein